MRYGLLVLGIALFVALSLGVLTWAYEESTDAALTDEARLAIDVRCPGENTRAGRECRGMLKRLYIAGALDPDRTLRTYCESIESERWQADRTVPPDVCVERYGGWL